MNKVVVVIGGSKGIGRATAEHFSKSGWRVVITGRTKQTLVEVQRVNPNFEIYVGDATDPESVNRLLQLYKAQYGRIDVVVLSAAEFDARPITQVDDEGWDKVGRWVAATGKINTKAARIMSDQSRGGVIVNIASFGGLREYVLENSSEYSAVKNAMVGAVVSGNKESDRVHLAVLCPAAVDTEMGRKAARKRGIDPSAIEWLSVEQVAKAVARIVNRASSNSPPIYLIEKKNNKVIFRPA